MVADAVFYGPSALAMDAKGRFAMPTRHRDALALEAASWRRFLLGSALDVELDGAGRLVIAPELRAYAGLQRDLMLMGVGKHFEIWDAATYALHEAATRASEMPDSVKSFVL